jgi:hypothetical protein
LEQGTRNFGTRNKEFWNKEQGILEQGTRNFGTRNKDFGNRGVPEISKFQSLNLPIFLSSYLPISTFP